MTKFYKAVREDYMDFATQTVKYTVGTEVVHRNPGKFGDDDASGYLSVTTDPTLCIGATWPCRLLEVEAEDYWQPHPHDTHAYSQKRAVHRLTVVQELDAWQFFGPQGETVAKLRAMETDLRRKRDGNVSLACDLSDFAFDVRMRHKKFVWYDMYRYEDMEMKRQQAVNVCSWGELTSLYRYLICLDMMDPENDTDAKIIKWVNDTIEAFESLHYKYTAPWWRKVLDRINK